MLKPERITRQETNRALNYISLLAQFPDKLDENLQKTEEGKLFARNAVNFLKNSNIYQYELPELPNGKVILTEEIYIKLCGFATCSNFFESYKEEFGRYIFGKEIDRNTILFGSINQTQQNTSTKEFNTTLEMQQEIQTVIKNNSVDCVCHVHTHPNSDNLYSGTPSNQDLYLYAWFQEQFNDANKDISFIGALITPTENTKEAFNDICFVFYDKTTKKFYKITDIYYLNAENKVIPLPKEKYEQIRNKNIESVETRTVLLKQYK